MPYSHDAMEDILYYTMPKINKPIRFWGLSSLQLGGMILVTMVVFLGTVITKQAVTGVIILSSAWVFIIQVVIKKLNKEHKRGTPDYMSSYFIYAALPKKITDKNLIFSFLLKK